MTIHNLPTPDDYEDILVDRLQTGKNAKVILG